MQRAAVAVNRTLEGRDGALVEGARTVAGDGPGRPYGACLITRAPDVRAVPAPMRGRPHRTWIAVAPTLQRRGVGTAMLRRALGRLRDAGELVLFSTFHVGNGASAPWHRDNGFALESSPYSMRRRRDDDRE